MTRLFHAFALGSLAALSAFSAHAASTLPDWKHFTDLRTIQVETLDDDRKASMVSNLMIVLCAESEVQPVINTGTLYG